MGTVATTETPAAAGGWLDRGKQALQRNPTEFKWLAGIIAVFLLVFFMPMGTARFDNAILEGLALLNWYAREHVMLCLVPAFFIAGAIAVFISQDAVMKYLGPEAHKTAAYGVASVSGSILAVCSCTVLPLFGGIYRRGAGLGPAVAFLYSGPAINVLAIVLTAKILGMELGVARAVGAVGFALVIGLLMQMIYRRDERARAASQKGFVVGVLLRAVARWAIPLRSSPCRSRCWYSPTGRRPAPRTARCGTRSLPGNGHSPRWRASVWPGCWSGAGSGNGNRWRRPSGSSPSSRGFFRSIPNWHSALA